MLLTVILLIITIFIVTLLIVILLIVMRLIAMLLIFITVIVQYIVIALILIAPITTALILITLHLIDILLLFTHTRQVIIGIVLFIVTALFHIDILHIDMIIKKRPEHITAEILYILMFPRAISIITGIIHINTINTLLIIIIIIIPTIPTLIIPTIQAAYSTSWIIMAKATAEELVLQSLHDRAMSMCLML